MPTRIVLRDTDAPSQFSAFSPTRGRQGQASGGAGSTSLGSASHAANTGATGELHSSQEFSVPAANRSAPANRRASSPNTSPRMNSRKVVKFRPSIIRKLPSNFSFAEFEDDSQTDRQQSQRTVRHGNHAAATEDANANANNAVGSGANDGGNNKGNEAEGSGAQGRPNEGGQLAGRSGSNQRHEQFQQRQSGRRKPHLSKKDIRASPQLAGYWFQLLACTVMLISIVQFYKDEESDSIFDLFRYLDGSTSKDAANETSADAAGDADTNVTVAAAADGLRRWLQQEDTGSLSSDIINAYDSDQYFNSVNGPVLRWKLILGLVLSSVGVTIFFFVLLMHYDTIFFPRLWFYIFRGGSRAEQCLLVLLCLFWCALVFANTTALSVGELQANVFFTSWIGIVASAVNYGTWRTSAGKSSIAEQIVLHHRETTFNWMWLLAFTFFFALASTDIFYYRDELVLQNRGREVDLSREEWVYVLCIIWSLVAVCIVALLLNHYATSSIRLCSFVIGWRHVEGVVIFIMMGAYYFLIFANTGVSGVFNGIQNSYFAVWASFFNSVFTFGTWLRENKDIVVYLQPGRQLPQTTSDTSSQR